MKVPTKPGSDEVSRHQLTHVPFASWCEDCIAGRARGTGHFKKEVQDVSQWEADYTYYSEEGFEVSKSTERERAALVVTLTHEASGATATTVALRKGA